MKTLTSEEMANWEYIIEVNGMTFYMEEQNTLPLYLVDMNGIPTELSLDDDMNGTDGDMQDEKYTLLEMLKDDGFIIDYNRDYLFEKEELEEIHKIHDYYYGNIDSTTHYYKINDDLYAINPANDDEFYVWSDLQDMIRENTSELEAWHQGDEEFKKIYFGADCEEIKTVVQDENNPENNFLIVSSIGLEVDNPPYSFERVGITEEKELIYYSINNIDVKIDDRPSGYEFTLEEMRDNIKRIEFIENSNPNEVDYSELQELKGWDKDFKATPYKKDDVEAIFEFCKTNNKQG